MERGFSREGREEVVGVESWGKRRPPVTEVSRGLAIVDIFLLVGIGVARVSYEGCENMEGIREVSDVCVCLVLVEERCVDAYVQRDKAAPAWSERARLSTSQVHVFQSSIF